MKRLLLRLIRFYRRRISPARPPACRFIPTCSEYAYLAVERFLNRPKALCWPPSGWPSASPSTGRRALNTTRCPSGSPAISEAERAPAAGRGTEKERERPRARGGIP